MINEKDNIADTFYIPLLMKCNESNRKEPFFRDPFACEMVNKIDYNFSKYKKAVRSSVGVAIRAKYFDEVTANFIQKHKNPIVVIVGCGLDTRYQRLGKEITGKAIFYELDIPESIELREKLLPVSENDIYLKNSMFETDWMDELKDKHPQAVFLFVVEGVFDLITDSENGFFTYDPDTEELSLNAIVKTTGFAMMFRHFGKEY